MIKILTNGTDYIDGENAEQMADYIISFGVLNEQEQAELRQLPASDLLAQFQTNGFTIEEG